MAGQAEVMVAGGVEDMTTIPMIGDPAVRESWLAENTTVYTSMGITAENVAAKCGITREEMDAFAIQSHKRAAAAQEAGKFDQQIIPIQVKDEDGNLITVSKDEGIRANSTMEDMAKLKTVFKEDGVVTAGTASQTSEGCAFVVMMSEAKAEELGIKPIARFVSFAVAGLGADIMGLGPIEAVPKAMKLANLTPSDMDVVELNEAFAAQAIPCIRELGLDIDKVNPYGGANALGHPLGATGAILTCKALSFLEETGKKYALVSMCIGGGMGAAGIFKRV